MMVRAALLAVAAAVNYESRTALHAEVEAHRDVAGGMRDAEEAQEAAEPRNAEEYCSCVRGWGTGAGCAWPAAAGSDYRMCTGRRDDPPPGAPDDGFRGHGCAWACQDYPADTCWDRYDAQRPSGGRNWESPEPLPSGLYTLASAQAECIRLGPSRCKSVACDYSWSTLPSDSHRRSEWYGKKCRLHGDAMLLDSPMYRDGNGFPQGGETTFVPSKDCTPAPTPPPTPAPTPRPTPVPTVDYREVLPEELHHSYQVCRYNRDAWVVCRPDSEYPDYPLVRELDFSLPGPPCERNGELDLGRCEYIRERYAPGGSRFDGTVENIDRDLAREDFSFMQTIDTLRYRNDSFTDATLAATFVKFIPFLTGLQTLDLRDNQLTALPAELADLANLTEIYVAGNPITSVPAALQGKVVDLETPEPTPAPTEQTTTTEEPTTTEPPTTTEQPTPAPTPPPTTPAPATCGTSNLTAKKCKKLKKKALKKCKGTKAGSKGCRKAKKKANKKCPGCKGFPM